MSELKDLFSATSVRQDRRGGIIFATDAIGECLDDDPSLLIATDPEVAKALVRISGYIRKELAPEGVYGITMRTPTGITAIPFLDNEGAFENASSTAKTIPLKMVHATALKLESDTVDPVVELYISDNLLTFTVYDKHSDAHWTAQITPEKLLDAISFLAPDEKVVCSCDVDEVCAKPDDNGPRPRG